MATPAQNSVGSVIDVGRDFKSFYQGCRNVQLNGVVCRGRGYFIRGISWFRVTNSEVQFIADKPYIQPTARFVDGLLAPKIC